MNAEEAKNLDPSRAWALPIIHILATADWLLAELERRGAEVRVEQTPVGEELLICGVNRLPKEVFETVMELESRTVTTIKKRLRLRGLPTQSKLVS
jgi:hypothetical protein